MRVKIVNKKNRAVGHLQSSNLSSRCDIQLRYDKKSTVILDIQRCLLKRYTLIEEGRSNCRHHNNHKFNKLLDDNVKVYVYRNGKKILVPISLYR